MAIPINPSFSTIGKEWQIESPTAVDGAQQGAGGKFGGALTKAISSLEDGQNQAASAAQSVVDGSATDISSVTMTVERARLEMQLASQIRNKAIQGFEEIFHTQV
jgi:flagellar hook-basal body complex protein FliE